MRNTTPSIGERVMVLSHIDENKKAHLLGFGTYEGDFPVGLEAAGYTSAVYRAQGKSIPKIVLESGEAVWGAECWFGREEEVRKLLEISKISEIVPQELKELREAAPKFLVVKFFHPPNAQVEWVPIQVSLDIFNKMIMLTEYNLQLQGEHLRLVRRYSISLTSEDNGDEEIHVFDSLHDADKAVERVVNDGYTRIHSKLA